MRNLTSIVLYGILIPCSVIFGSVSDFSDLEDSLMKSRDAFYSTIGSGDLEFKYWVLSGGDNYADRVGVTHAFKLGNIRLNQGFAIIHGILLYKDRDNLNMVWRVDTYSDLWIHTDAGWRVTILPREHLELNVDKVWLDEMRMIAGSDAISNNSLNDLQILSEFFEVIRVGEPEEVLRNTREDFQGEDPSSDVVSTVVAEFVKQWRDELASLEKWTVSLVDSEEDSRRKFIIHGVKRTGLDDELEPWIIEIVFALDDQGWFFSGAKSGNVKWK